MLFGYPTKYFRFVTPGVNDEAWDEAVYQAVREYKQQTYNFLYSFFAFSDV